jgi:hypothetical protein
MRHNLSITFIKYQLAFLARFALLLVNMRKIRVIGLCPGVVVTLHAVKKRLQYLSFDVTIYQNDPAGYAGSSVKGGLVGDPRQAGAVEQHILRVM